MAAGSRYGRAPDPLRLCPSPQRSAYQPELGQSRVFEAVVGSGLAKLRRGEKRFDSLPRSTLADAPHA